MKCRDSAAVLTRMAFPWKPQETDSDGELRVEPNQITVNEKCRGKLGSDSALNVLGC